MQVHEHGLFGKLNSAGSTKEEDASVWRERISCAVQARCGLCLGY